MRTRANMGSAVFGAVVTHITAHKAYFPAERSVCYESAGVQTHHLVRSPAPQQFSSGILGILAFSPDTAQPAQASECSAFGEYCWRRIAPLLRGAPTLRAVQLP